ncbi:Calcipressin-2 [Colletotrichum sidae]|uniref:Calcipressin-2 n=4 Tax=Colletotrichum orbiculare species complex TaxID=2707354 RepID=N4W3G5_COLOR|nr:Calcipressin-2 [Colletotrichum orbiculare MAFF 240422]TDZ37899.1 Calcipressin-2 [Colletotrichum spinosum]TDZ74609.1 Calcipressin-2 [Colletotrichum trifolii]TEA17427.1 Calcipressin-2 [Colletotrichum sidae]
MESPKLDTRPIFSRRSSSSMSLSLDLSSLPPLVPPTPPSNTLLVTNLNDTNIFRPDNLQTIRELITKTAQIHSFAPLKSFRRIVVSFFSEDDAIAVRRIWDNEAIMGERVRVYFGQPTPVEVTDRHLALPDAGKLFFISPPPSPPHGWEMKLEDAPNKLVHAEDLAEALAKLHHRPTTGIETPISPVDGSHQTRSRSSTLLYQPDVDGCSPDLPAICLEDMTDEPMDISPIENSKPIMAHTSRPPVELMLDA